VKRAELSVALLLLAAAACAVVFVVAYALDWANLTQWLGLSLGASLGFVATALIVAAKRLVVVEERTESYPPEGGAAEEQERVVRIVAESGEGITRKRLLFGAAGAAAGALGAALLAPAASLGPALDTGSLYGSPWRRGRRLVDETGEPMRAEEIETGTFYTAYPEDAEREEIAAPLAVVRLEPDQIALPPERVGWAPGGILAFSKICTHAGCAVSLYRHPKFEPTQPRPALVCPCHYSTFDPADGGGVIFGPAGRALPQLPLQVDEQGELCAAGNFSAPVGPSFWGVRTRRPTA
jgi:ubiquinol-cytochrome c reductase iron-sulfur subunit